MTDWRIYLECDDEKDWDLVFLAKATNSMGTLVKRDAEGYYLTSFELNALKGEDEARAAAAVLIQHINGAGRLAYNGFRRIRPNGVAVDDSTGVRTIRMKAAASWRVHAWSSTDVDDGSAETPQSPQRLGGYLSASKPVVDALYWLGLRDNPNWVELYAAYDVLRIAAGGTKQALEQRTNVPPSRIKLFCENANKQDLHGFEARHPKDPSKPATMPSITLAEGLEIVRELVNGFM